MRRVKPEAKFLSWTYGHRGWEYEDIEEYVEKLPSDARMVQGFEDNGSEESDTDQSASADSGESSDSDTDSPKDPNQGEWDPQP
jgi:hypothetical protein